MSSMIYLIEDEIALEGLDGITLDSLWFRLSERVKIELPFYENYKNKLLKVILKQSYFEYFVIAQPRKTVGRLDRAKLITADETAVEQVKEFYDVYSWAPVDHPELRGSCAEFDTRKQVDRESLEDKTVADLDKLYGQRFVIVASQKLRNKALIPGNVGRDVDINNHAYCLLERIGRSRYFGEATSGPYSINTYIKDLKLIHYFRSSLLKNRLVIRQQFSNKALFKTSNITQLFHLPRFYIMIQSTQLRHIETLSTHLLTKENNLASLEEVRNLLQLASKTAISNIRARPDIFEYRHFPYSEVFPNASREEATFKKGSEKKLMAVKLINPNFDILELYKDEVKEKDPECDDDNGFLDISNQHVRRPLIHQVIEAIKASKSVGMSQTDIGNYLGLSRLNARSVMRKITRQQSYNITSYLKDEGRQRVSMFISKEYLSDKKKEFVDQVARLLNTTDNTQKSICNIKPDVNQVITNDMETVIFSEATLPTLPIIKEERSPNKSVINIQPACSSWDDDGVFAVPQVPISTKSTNETVMIMPDNECSFVDNIESVKVTLKFLNNIPGIQKHFSGLQKAIEENKVSQKVLSRMNIILDVMKDQTVIDTLNLLHTLRQREANFSEVCCRKSMLTLCGRLAADNLIKVIQMELISATNVIKLIYFGIPTVTFDMRCWNSIIEEQKIQHFVSVPKPKIIDKQETPAIRAISWMSLQSQQSVVYGEFDAQSTRHENFPKFMKYRLFHEFLYYLIYNYPAEIEKTPVKKAVEIWQRQNQRCTDYDEIAERISTCYSTEINWKMFIPPLNQHFEYKDGWGLLRDIIHRIPLILFVKFTRFAKETPELDEYIMHPIKSNYLLHFLPPKLRSQLLQGRKFIITVSELCKRLCWLGLLQFGPQRTKEVDQSYIYLNRNAMLLDTRTSDVGYLEVSEKEYPKLTYHFDSIDALTNYWTAMFDICINTRINKKSTAIGKTIILEQLYTKPQLISALKSQTTESAPINDTGEIPGDRKGAGGLDKGFMSHLKQSWSRTIDRKRRPASALSVERQPKKAKKENVEPKKRKKVIKSKSVPQTSKAKGTSTSTAKTKTVLPSRNAGANSKIIRRVKARKKTIKEMKRSRETYDEIDQEALKVMKTLRVTWSEIEDKTLMFSKVAMKFAFPNEAQRSHYVSCAVVRDILHWRTDRALNKTSKACQRRINYLMKTNKQFKEQTFLTLEELRANREFTNKYTNFAERLKKLYNQEQIYVAVKIHLVEMIHQVHQLFLKEFYSNLTENSQKSRFNIPQDYKQLLRKFNVVNPNALIDDYKYTEPMTSTEVEISMLSSLIHGAVCSANDKIRNTFFLLETYKKFSDDNLGAAVSRLRQLAVVSLNKNQRSRDKVVMPYSISPFHLSNRYAAQLMSVHVPVELYDEYLDSIKTFSDNAEKAHMLKNVNCGWIFMLAEMLNLKKVSLSIEKVPAVTDSPIRKKTLFDRFSENYQIMKRNKEQQKNDVKSTRMFRLPEDNNSDEKFIFNDDPLEIFFKLDPRYLHIFCILQSIEHHQTNDIEKWSIQEDDEECTFKHCIIRAGASFSIEIQKIACHCYQIVKSILADDEPGPSKHDENAVTKYNLVQFFDNFIEKYSEEKIAAMRKDVGKVNASEFHHKVSTKFLLNAIQRLSTEIEIEDGVWLSEYKKISDKSEDEIFDDDEDVDASTKSLSQSISLSSKAQDSFIVNLAFVSVEVKADERKEICAIDGETFCQGLTPFSEQIKTKLLDDIKKMHLWMPEDLMKKSFDEDIKNVDAVLVQKNKAMTKNVYEFIKSKGHTGASIYLIFNRFGNGKKKQLHKSIDILLNGKLILKTGVNELRFVHKEFAAFWLVDTFYLTPRDTEAEEEPQAKKAKMDDKVVRVPTNNDEMAMDVEQVTETTENAEPEPEQQKQQSDGISPEEKRNLIRNSYYLHPAPWVRVGSLNRILNRRCIDKWLGTILIHISINPCILLSDLCQKFNIITPFHVFSLCEILESIGCVKLLAHAPLEVSIFSEYNENDEKIEAATHLDSFDRIFIEVNTDAFQRLTFFIGKKKYKIPFV